MHHFLTLSFITLFLSGCVSLPSEESHERFMGNQKASIVGSSVGISQKPHEPCLSVLLVPDTVYFNKILSLKSKIKNKDLSYIRKARCSTTGNFSFKNLPEENWLMIAFHRYEKATPHSKSTHYIWDYKIRHAHSKANTINEIHFAY